MDVARVEALDPPAKARVIWAVLQVHIRMDEVVKDNLKAHRVVQTAMANFNMRTRVDKSTVDALDKKVKDAEKSLATIQKDHVSLQADFGKTKQTVNSEIANLKKAPKKG
jgi:septal ring factor EnvC (AmiA/AmiB activator)